MITVAMLFKRTFAVLHSAQWLGSFNILSLLYYMEVEQSLAYSLILVILHENIVVVDVMNNMLHIPIHHWLQ